MTSHHETTLSEHLYNSDIKSGSTGYTMVSIEKEPTLSRRSLDQTVDNNTHTAKTADCAKTDKSKKADQIVKNEMCKSAKEPVIFSNNDQAKETDCKNDETNKITAQTVKDEQSGDELVDGNVNSTTVTDYRNNDNRATTHQTVKGEICEQQNPSLVDRNCEPAMHPGCKNVETGKTTHTTVGDDIGKQTGDSLEDKTTAPADKTTAPAKAPGCKNEQNSKTTHIAVNDETDKQRGQALLNKNTEPAMETGCKNEESSETTDQTVKDGIREVPVQTLINKQMEGKRKIKHEPKKPSFISQNIAAASIASLSDKPRFRAGANKHDIPPTVSRQNNQSESKLDKSTAPRVRSLGTEGVSSVTSSISDIIQYSYYHDWQQRRPQPARGRVHKRRSKHPPPIAYLNLPMKTTGSSIAWKTTKEPLKRPVKDQNPLNPIPNKPPESAYGLGPTFKNRLNLPKIQPKNRYAISETHTSYLRKLPKTIGSKSLWKMPRFVKNSKPVVQSYRASDARHWGMRISRGIHSQQPPPLPLTDR